MVAQKKNNMFRSLFLLFLILSSGSLLAQDFHFSQFFATPTLTNPAMNGNHGAGFRFGGINRSQFGSGANNFQTVALYGDAALLQNAVAEESWIGVGGKLYYDNAGQGAINTLHIAGLVTFHKALTDVFYISLGGSFGFTTKSLDPTDFSFNNQYTEQGFDLALANGEGFIRDSYSFLDVDAGISGTYTRGKNTRLTVGVSLVHINRAGETYYLEANTNINRRAFRPVMHINGDFGFNGFNVEPGLLFSRDRGAQEFIYGSNFSLGLNTGSRVTFGMWHRWGESLVPLLGFEILRTRIYATYDINMQSLQNFASNRSAFEISVAHTGKWRERSGGIACPRF